MKRLVLLLVAFTLAQTANAQLHEIGAYVGYSNFIGDVGSTQYINPNHLAYGAIYKWNRSARHSFRASITRTLLEGKDIKSDDPSRQFRGLEFTNTITELSLGIEFTFWDFNLHNIDPQSTPYIYTGISYFSYDTLFLDDGNIIPYGDDAAFAIPMVLGYKATISEKMIIAFEIGARYTFTDDLDGSNPVNDKEDFDNLKFGNINSNDWYMFTGITLTYTFGKKPCYCY
ncbi:hypothetical protein IMCC3317_36000 [Kordia antarctica]|uniref:DUF6089 domain-containing protein n=1 Tax=Kordia antarctica TaxID=1218801 RepID=A0A7L4ZNA6_9FLAO|nr:DUF6089 family protein [Kordia antarctica]QHI38213.1 hypothetical protein IMCC3317_36000 [Kordia antarctica]